MSKIIYQSVCQYFRNCARRLVALIAAVSAITAVMAFDPAVYTATSRLASGRWVKVGVEESGLYLLSNQMLRTLGFGNPANVRVYGYGGLRLPDELSVANYEDDLPAAPQQHTDAGLVFWAQGPEEWVRSGTNTRFHAEYNPYTTQGYYFVTEVSDGSEAPVPASSGVAATGTVSTATAMVHHEIEREAASESGPLMVGEDFRYKTTQTFNFDLPGRVPDTDVWFECQFISLSTTSSAQLLFANAGTQMVAMSTDRISPTSSSAYVHASLANTRHTYRPADSNPEKTAIDVTYKSSGTFERANLDYISVNYERSLTMPSTGSMEFWSSARDLVLSGATADLVIWDVTDNRHTTRINCLIEGDKAHWQPSYSGMRRYVAWRPGATLPAPATRVAVANQNLHGDSGDDMDMVIFAPSALMGQARRIADLHKRDSLKVRCVDVAPVYNEFASGSPDPGALRLYLKMLYDRGTAAGRPLRYALLLGRTTLDHREIMASTRDLGYTTLPVWVNRTARHSMNDYDGYTTDDFFAMLGDGSGRDPGLDDLTIAVGRIPMMSENDGASIVDKMYQYVNSSKRSWWKNRVMVLADDEDRGVHLRQAESMIKNFMATEGQQHIFEKIYLDAYIRSGGEYPQARREMFGLLDQGVAWWFFTGHANNHSWTGDGQLTYTDLNNLYLRNLPFLVASTCDFLRWDSPTTSGGEIMFKERYGGVIGMISATRPVYIPDNGYYLEALGRATLARDENGCLLTPGEVYRRSKNDILNSKGEHRSNDNRLRFVFMGDPALAVTSPSNVVEVTAINGLPPRPENEVTIAALSNTEITGRIVTPDGTPIEDFNGTVNVEIYDALMSRVTNGNGDGSIETFDTHGDKLFAGSARVEGGKFTLRAPMPSTVADNFRQGTMSLYAAADNSDAEAIGVERRFYVYGFEEPAAPDTIAPRIETFVLNHKDFISGDGVNSSPVVLATVSDNVGINLSASGIGQQMTLIVDGTRTYTDLAAYYTPAADGSASGSIAYQLENLTEGSHSMRLRVFDTSGNAATADLDCFVDDNLRPQIFAVYSDANPATTAANFYVRHDRPENIVEVTVTVFDLLGHALWTGSSKGMSDMNTSAPVTWDLTDSAGRRVNRGIYIYRASISTDNANYETASRRIAVAAQ